MNPLKSPTIQSLHGMCKVSAYASRDKPVDTEAVACWQRQSQESIDQTRQALAQHWSVRLEGRLAVLSALAGAALGVYLVFAYDLVALTLFAIMGAIVGLFVWQALVRPLAQWGRPALQHLLEPASREPFLCKSALDCVESQPAVREYRDATVATGRALTVADLHWMLELGYRAKSTGEEESLRQNCLRLHGVAS